MASYAAIREPESLKRPLWFSLAFHGALVLLFIGNAIYSRTGNDWGGPGGAITVGVVGSLPAVPLPTPEISTPSRVVDESKGLYKAEPPEAPPIVPPDALPIPKFDKVKPPKYVTRPSKVLENPKPPPPNAVPYGGGGTPTVPPLDLISSELQNQWGMGIRDQVQLSGNFRLDGGLRYDLISQGFGPNLYYVDENVQPVPGSPTTPYVSGYPFAENPHFLEPRLGAAWLLVSLRIRRTAC